jgi:hypothetical protein
MVSETGGMLQRGQDLSVNLVRAASEIDSGYTLTYQSSHGDDARYHPVQVTIARREADARTRAGYVSPPSAEMRNAMRDSISNTSVPMRMLRRSPLIDVWSGLSRRLPHRDASSSPGAGAGPGRATKSGAARVTLKATTKDGRVLFEGLLAPVRIGEAADAMWPDRAEFDAPTGRVQLDLTILDMHEQKLDYDARDLEVPAMKGTAPLLLPAILIATQSAKEFRSVTADLKAALIRRGSSGAPSASSSGCPRTPTASRCA